MNESSMRNPESMVFRYLENPVPACRNTHTLNKKDDFQEINPYLKDAAVYPLRGGSVLALLTDKW
mgnify:CR=1 FL=1